VAVVGVGPSVRFFFSGYRSLSLISLEELRLDGLGASISMPKE
jgi:hypothetical protein